MHFWCPISTRDPLLVARSSWDALLVPHFYTGSTSGGSFFMGCTSGVPSLHEIHFWWLVLHGHSRSIHHYSCSLFFMCELSFDALYFYFFLFPFLFAHRACWLTTFWTVDLFVGRCDLVPPRVPWLPRLLGFLVDPLVGRYCDAASSYQ